jgi:hypothetical protein
VSVFHPVSSVSRTAAILGQLARHFSSDSKRRPRLLNLTLAGASTQVNIANMTTLGDLQDAIKLKYANATKGVDAPQLQLYDQQRNQITSWSSLSALADTYFTDGGVSLAVSVFGM